MCIGWAANMLFSRYARKHLGPEMSLDLKVHDKLLERNQTIESMIEKCVVEKHVLHFSETAECGTLD